MTSQSPAWAGTGDPPLRATQAYSAIKAMIINGDLASGARIGAAQLSRQLDMSRTPVHEALTRLAAEGLLIASPRQGFTVAPVDPADLAKAYRVRAVLEGLAAEETAKRATRVDIARLEDLYDAMSDAIARKDDDELARLNSRFHQTIAAASGNPYLVTMLDSIRDIFERFRAVALVLPGRSEDAHREHGELIAALRDRDPGRARELADGHVGLALEARTKNTVTAREERG